MHHVWREGQKEPFEFYQKNNWHVLKSGYIRRAFPDVDINVLHASCAGSAHEEVSG